MQQHQKAGVKQVLRAEYAHSAFPDTATDDRRVVFAVLMPHKPTQHHGHGRGPGQGDSSVMQTALTGRHPHLGYWEHKGPKDMEKAENALVAVDLKGFAGRSVTGLSGGEARRLAFATLLMQEPDLMLLDEPTNHLDLRHQLSIMRMIRNHTETENHSAFCALHDVNLAARYCSHVLMLFGEGEWCAGRCEDMLSENSLERLYGCPVERLESGSGPRFHPRGY